MKNIEVVAAVIVKDSQIFVAQRADKGEVALKWEFPGGKIEAGETHQGALARELREELGVEARIGEFVTTVFHQYQTFHLTMHAYLVTLLSGDLQLTEHVSSKWLMPNELPELDWAPADIPIAHLVARRLAESKKPE